MKPAPISVVMATYNGAKYLEEQLESILCQKLRPDEIIVCDDKSTDDTQKILKKFSFQNTVLLHVNETRLGVINNFKKGASLSKRANFIAFSDQDDIWDPDKLQTLYTEILAYTNQSKPAMVFSDLRIMDKEKKIINESLWDEFGINPDKQTFKTLLIRNIVPGCAMLINEKMKEEFLKIPNVAYMHDAWITFIAYAFQNYSYIRHPLINHRNHDDNVMHPEIADNDKSLYAKLSEYINGILNDKPLLVAELTMAQAFYDIYKDKMQANDVKAFYQFLKLKHKNFFLKKMHIRYINRLEYP